MVIHLKTYKARLDNRIVLSHNRIDHMLEDKYGFLWLQTYDNHAYRFDPRTETFERAPGDDEEGGHSQYNEYQSPSGWFGMVADGD